MQDNLNANKKADAREKGKYAVPPEIRALKPEGISSIVKKIDGHYYVYEYLRVEDPKRPGKKKNATGRYLGKIEGGAFIPWVKKPDP